MQSKAAMEAFVMDLLKNNLPSHYYYHNYEHTLYVIDKAVEIGKHENCTEQELALIRTAACWHDAGCIYKYVGHEKEGCILARKHLPAYGYSTVEIDKICGMIMATKLPQSPKNKLEEIIADADLEYLGAEDPGIKADTLFKELSHINPALTELEWNQIQISFLQQHHYFTRFCKKNKAPAKQAYLRQLLENTR